MCLTFSFPDSVVVVVLNIIWMLLLLQFVCAFKTQPTEIVDGIHLIVCPFCISVKYNRRPKQRKYDIEYRFVLLTNRMNKQYSSICQ